jgi:hypothetical protein
MDRMAMKDVPFTISTMAAETSQIALLDALAGSGGADTFDIFDICSCYPDVSRFKKTDLRRPSRQLWRTRRRNLLKFYSCSS